MSFAGCIKLAKDNFNECGLNSFTSIARCVGFGYSDEDYYWKLMVDKNEFHWCSMVGRFDSLRPLWDEKTYEYFDNMMNDYWGYPRAKEFTIEYLGKY